LFRSLGFSRNKFRDQPTCKSVVTATSASFRTTHQAKPPAASKRSRRLALSAAKPNKAATHSARRQCRGPSLFRSLGFSRNKFRDQPTYKLADCWEFL